LRDSCSNGFHLILWPAYPVLHPEVVSDWFPGAASCRSREPQRLVDISARIASSAPSRSGPRHVAHPPCSPRVDAHGHHARQASRLWDCPHVGESSDPCTPAQWPDSTHLQVPASYFRNHTHAAPRCHTVSTSSSLECYRLPDCRGLRMPAVADIECYCSTEEEGAC
jgi:hypothetical protein